MRKVSIVLLVGLMLIGGLSVGIYAQSTGSSADGSDVTANTKATTEINTIVALYVHGDVELGTLDSGSFDSDGNFSGLNALSSTNNTVKAFSNAESGYTVAVKVSENGVGDNSSYDLGDFKFSKDTTGSTSTYSSFSDTESSLNVINVSSPGSNTATVGYKYSPDKDDAPGTYKAELQYTISTK